MSKRKRVALFGGTFDPIHRGHLNLSIAAMEYCNLTELIFLPNYISPFKQSEPVTPGTLRAEMVASILHYHPGFVLSRYELERAAPSYTFDTLNYFRRIYEPDAEIAFLVGWDSIISMDTWYHGKELIQDTLLITGARPHTSESEGWRKIMEYRRQYQARITVLELEPFDASSTEIRNRVRSGEDISSLVAPEVKEYIYRHGLYQDR